MMSTSTLFLGLAALSVSYYVVFSVIAWWRLRAFNGPFLASFSYLWILRILRSGRHGELLRPVVDKNATTRIGPNELLTSDPVVIRRMNAVRSRYTRSNWYSLNRLIPGEDSMFSLLDTAEHDKVKAQTAAGYNGKDVPGLEADIDSVIATMVNKIRTKYAADPSNPTELPKPHLDMGRMAQYFTLDSIMKIAFARSFGFLETESDPYGHLDMLDEMVPTMNCVSMVPYLAYIASSSWITKLLTPSEKNAKGIFKILPITRAIVAERFHPSAEAEKKNDMLASFIAHGLTEMQCNNEAVLQVLAGSDTTATAFRSTMLYIITTPRIYNTLQYEIDLAIQNGKISAPITSAESVAHLPYLQAVIWEGLRFHPPFNGFPFKLVPPEGDTIDGKFVPGGTRIAPSYEKFTRLTSVFGEDANVFRPERWLPATWRVGFGQDAESLEWEGGEKERVAEMRRTVELVFGYGRFGCAGRFVAFLELNKVFVELLRHFDFQIVDPTNPWESKNYALFMQRNMWVRVLLRGQ
ncbi:cytochrome P450 monooxygenase [Cercophora newfieldiana]|uniref:Cytochrome P450 monooxygenase n=1 Tax=Cercophora newfieldiana TaxID=92897 RepID=A0AA40CPC2_9PEZI|nr:cytochrome P450 monooxygenase [Cercophora newfieldiana]